MRVSDAVFSLLRSINVDTVYMLSGGGIMYLVDALGRSGLRYVCCHHEQAASIAAQAHGMYNDDLGVCLVTTGPGGTNAITGCGAAYMDSTPVLYISGQVKTSDFASIRGVRQFGAQENDIISMVKPVTKYAVLVTKPGDVIYELEKCIHMARSGRKGPVWIDIPLDVQSAEIDIERVRRYKCEENLDSLYPEVLKASVKHTIDMLIKANRPVLLIGHGVVSSRSSDMVRKFLEKTQIPLLATWRALDVVGTEERGFYGSPGLQAPRYSNFILQQSDALIVLGSRLDNMITAFNEPHFAYNAEKVIVDIDANEIDKLDMKAVYPVVSDVKVFLEALLNELEYSDFSMDYNDWIKNCDVLKAKYPILNEKQEIKEGVDLYKVTMAISELSHTSDTIVISSTSRCNTAGHIAFNRKGGQKSISSMGFGSMGFALPSAVGAYYAGGIRRVIMIEGDGSFQLNIQELETVVSNDIDVKMFIFSNRGYAAITTMQERNFDGFYVGSNEKSGVFMPDLAKIASAYGVPYLRIELDEDIEYVIGDAMNRNGAVLCEVCGGLHFDEIPKCISRINPETGKRESAFLEKPYPFI